jgi:hypothetical protein
MSQSLSSVFLHIVFSTKERFPFLSDEDVRRQVHAFLGGIAKKLNCPPILIGGVSDHVHILIQLGRSVSQADLVNFWTLPIQGRTHEWRGNPGRRLLRRLALGCWMQPPLGLKEPLFFLIPLG